MEIVKIAKYRSIIFGLTLYLSPIGLAMSQSSDHIGDLAKTELQELGANFSYHRDGYSVCLTRQMSDRFNAWEGHFFDLTKVFLLDDLVELEVDLPSRQMRRFTILSRKPKLKRLKIGFSMEINKHLFEDVVENCIHLEELSVFCFDFSHCKELHVLSELSGLKRLTLRGFGVNSEFVEVINNLPKLTYLDVSGMTITKEFAENLNSDLGLEMMFISSHTEGIVSIKNMIWSKYPTLELNGEKRKQTKKEDRSN